MKSIAIIALSAAFLTACTTPTEKALEIHDDLVYFKDHRSGLCFAYWMYEGDSRSGVMSLVPCEKVEHLLVNTAERGR